MEAVLKTLKCKKLVSMSLPMISIVNNSYNRSKSVYKEQDWARNGSNGSRSTATHSSGLPPAVKKNSSISADYGSNYQQKL